MKNDRSERAGDAVLTESKVHDRVWGDSAEGPVHSGDDVVPGGQWDRDERLDPWGGAPVQNVDVLPSAEPRFSPSAPVENPIDHETGGDAGIVGRDEVLDQRSTEQAPGNRDRP
jgi:hypothetical protein